MDVPDTMAQLPPLYFPQVEVVVDVPDTMDFGVLRKAISAMKGRSFHQSLGDSQGLGLGQGRMARAAKQGEEGDTTAR